MLIAKERVNTEEMKINLYKELADAAERIMALLRFQSMDVYQICETVFSKEKCCLPSFCSIRESFSDRWIEACKTDILPISQDACELFESAGSFLGQYDIESQLERLGYIKDELLHKRDFALEELAKKKKLYYCLGGFAGMMVCLIFL